MTKLAEGETSFKSYLPSIYCRSHCGHMGSILWTGGGEGQVGTRSPNNHKTERELAVGEECSEGEVTGNPKAQSTAQDHTLQWKQCCPCLHKIPEPPAVNLISLPSCHSADAGQVLKSCLSQCGKGPLKSCLPCS